MIGAGAIKAFVAEILRSLSVNVGTNADAASATGSVHAKLKDVKASSGAVCVSDILQVSADTERNQYGTTPALLKNIAVAFSGMYRVKFDLKSEQADHMAYGQIYKNDVAFGTLQTNNTITYVTKTQDLFFSAGDSVQLYAYNVTSNKRAYVRNFRLYFDKISVSTVITD